MRHARHDSLSSAGAGKSLRNLQSRPGRMNIHLGGFHPSSGQNGGCGGPTWSHNIHSHQYVTQPGGTVCKQQPRSLPQHSTMRPQQRSAVASQAQLAQKAETGGSCSRRETGAQSAVLLLAFLSDTTLARGWALFHIFHPASLAAEVLGLQPLLHPLTAAMAPPGAVGARSLPLLVDGGLQPARGSQTTEWGRRHSKSTAHCHSG